MKPALIAALALLLPATGFGGAFQLRMKQAAPTPTATTASPQAPEASPEVTNQSVLRVNSTNQVYDYQSPWQKKPPYARRGLGVSWEVAGEIPPRPCDPGIVEALEQAASARGVPWIRMASGAAHDAQQLALVAPVGMLFVQSRDGRSHTPEEFTATEHAVAGTEVLAAALNRLAW